MYKKICYSKAMNVKTDLFNMLLGISCGISLGINQYQPMVYVKLAIGASF